MSVFKHKYFPQTSRCLSRRTNGHSLTFRPVEVSRRPCPLGDLLTYADCLFSESSDSRAWKLREPVSAGVPPARAVAQRSGRLARPREPGAQAPQCTPCWERTSVHSRGPGTPVTVILWKEADLL